jgi:hypothetical protein
MEVILEELERPTQIALPAVAVAREDEIERPGLRRLEHLVLTLVTLDCGPFDIATSVSEVDDAVYSPAVLRLPGQSCGGKVKITQVRERRRCYQLLEHAQVVVYGPVLDLFAVRESKDVDRGERMLPVPQTPNRGN